MIRFEYTGELDRSTCRDQAGHHRHTNDARAMARDARVQRAEVTELPQQNGRVHEEDSADGRPLPKLEDLQGRLVGSKALAYMHIDRNAAHEL